ncbi:hypothetical protein C3747_7g284 [Trypanosoma cruzi]|uniref:CID domain-containing protein n=2 Tax=Trypanosoma cruzi TaxID=5693 RepID=Q4DLJ3_TRYCC|nr:hypothetical protein, conserved [Trypanosoma cruzi]EAN93395.1 hypothetical protein, conserved [Trypanosoma cruzi]PWV20327.1 hypothetical protein C3747_7g284 [Trypanosoma cruzi]|eukprot:XP_815246.1 hypothetical protein [Trypanosoma cruzi strain CL Brener]
MDAFQAKLDALQKQSKEQIMATITALQSACGEGVQPVRIAVAIGNRLTHGQIPNSFPVICLIDAMAATQDEACIATVLEEFWRIAPSLFVNYSTADEALREKVLRAVKRWGGKRLFPSTYGEKLLSCISGKEMNKMDSEKVHHSVDNNVHTISHSGNATKDKMKEEFSRSEVSGFCAILQSCVKMIEGLPPHRASMYLDVVRKEKLLHTPSKSALLFFQGLHAELSRESALYNSNVVKNEHQANSALSGKLDTKAALGNLLDKLSKEQTSSVDAATAAVAAAGGHKDLAFNVIRYTSPMQSDICQRLSVAQRAGFGEWHRRTKNEYHYPKRESNTRREFRAPAGSQAGTRAWFPTEQQWISENDMAALKLWLPKETVQERDSSNVYNVVRKRERDA